MRLLSCATALCLVAASAQAAEVQATITLIDANGLGAPIGTVTVTDGQDGAVIKADLVGLPPGEHGFHVHENGDCAPAANAEGAMTAGLAAGGHFDPADTERHEGPHGQGHLGDIPFIFVASDGTAMGASKAPRLTDVAQLKGKALVIHAGGDNYSDEPKPLGGGGPRIACGVLE